MKLDAHYLSKSIGLLNPKPPIMVLPDAPLSGVLEKLKDESGGAVLICDEDDKLLGIFTERDVLKKVVLSQVKQESVEIGSLMTINPMTVSMTSPLGYALQLMTEGGFRHVPIVSENGDALGVLAMKDVVDEIVKSFVLK